MFGFFFGAACLGGLAALFFHRQRRRDPLRFGCGRGLRRDRAGLDYVLERLDTRPGQEKAIMAALDELSGTAKEVQTHFDGSRAEIGAALREPHFDAHRVDQIFERHTTDLALLKTAVTAALGKVHEALDEDQRQRLSRFVESGPRFGFA